MTTNVDELEELRELTDAIAANLRYIEEHSVYQNENLEELREQTDAIAANLKYIEENNG